MTRVMEIFSYKGNKTRYLYILRENPYDFEDREAELQDVDFDVQDKEARQAWAQAKVQAEGMTNPALIISLDSNQAVVFDFGGTPNRSRG